MAESVFDSVNAPRHVFGKTYPAELRQNRWPAPAALATTLKAATKGTTTAQTVISGISSPDFPRSLQIRITGSSGAVPAKVASVIGTNIADAALTELFTLTAKTRGTYTGRKAFKTVASVTIPTLTQSGGTFTIGAGAKLGFDRLLNGQTGAILIREVRATATSGWAADAGVRVTSPAGDISMCTFTPVSAADGVKHYRAFFITDDTPRDQFTNLN